MQATSTWVEANGVALRYRVEGSGGPWLVLVHEMGGMIETWDRLVPHLRAHLRILCFDTRGAGMSQKISGPVSIDDMADDLAALLDRLGIDEPVAVAGCAVGAAIVLNFAARYPSRAAAALVMNPAIGVTEENRPALLARAEALVRGGTREIVDDSLRAGYPQAFREDDPEHFALFKARWIGNDPVSLRALFLMLSEMDLSPLLANVACPVLGVSGRCDPLRPTSYVREVLSQLKNSRLEVIDAGHHMADQAPLPLARVIRQFLLRCDETGAPA